MNNKDFIAAAPNQRWSLWNLAFRPFYLGAAIFSTIVNSLWALQWIGIIPGIQIMTPLWHAHEMLFGYTLAVIVGFLLTAARVWTGRPTLSGSMLAALFFLWLAGRILAFTHFYTCAAIVNIVFPFIAAIAIAYPLVLSGSRKNYLFVVILALFGFASIVVQLAYLGWIALPGWVGIDLAFNLVFFIMVVMTGRVVPMFSNNGIVGLGARKHRVIDTLAPATVLLILLIDIIQVHSLVTVTVLLLSTVVHFSRQVYWRSHRTLGTPLVWILHAAYTWMVIHLILRVFVEFDMINPSLATHALTAGAVGTLTIGMMTRTSRGHLGLTLVSNRIDVWCFLSIISAAVIRVMLPLFVPGAYQLAIGLSAIFWGIGFILFIGHYGQKLCLPRVDGKAG